MSVVAGNVREGEALCAPSVGLFGRALDIHDPLVALHHPIGAHAGLLVN